jgi:cytochrome c oxidase subunit 3
MSTSRTLDVSGLATYAYGPRSLMWWGTVSMIVIESTVFVMAIVSYFYLRQFSQGWPPEGEPPDLTLGTVNLFIMLLSAWPNQWTIKAAHEENLQKVRIGLVLSALVATAFIIVRVFEFGALNTRWDANAYGSIVYALMILHTAHLVTDYADTLVLAVLMYKGPLEGRRFVDVSENGLYWWFVIVSWIVIYATIYIAPRLL